MNLESPNVKIRIWKPMNTNGSMQMDCFRSFSPSVCYIPPLKAEEQDHGSMEQVIMNSIKFYPLS